MVNDRAGGAAGRGRIVARVVAWSALAGVAILVVPTWWAQVRPPPGFPVEAERVQTAIEALPELMVVPEPLDLQEYEREHFGPPWYDLDGNGCDTRNDMLTHWLQDLTFDPVQPCLVVTGTLDDPYTGRQITFQRGPDTSGEVQIDHVVALADAWRKGADAWPSHVALAFANDPANLIAVDGGANQDKGAADAASWLPPHEGFRCGYVVQQVLVKHAYGIGVSSDEFGTLTEELQRCPDAPAASAEALWTGAARSSGLAINLRPRADTVLPSSAGAGASYSSSSSASGRRRWRSRCPWVSRRRSVRESKLDPSPPAITPIAALSQAMSR